MNILQAIHIDGSFGLNFQEVNINTLDTRIPIQKWKKIPEMLHIFIVALEPTIILFAIREMSLPHDSLARSIHSLTLSRSLSVSPSLYSFFWQFSPQ